MDGVRLVRRGLVWKNYMKDRGTTSAFADCFCGTQTGPGHHGDDEYEYEIHHFEKFHDESGSLLPPSALFITVA